MNERNFKGIQFEELRRDIDPKYNMVHDELTNCYYGKKPFRNYGILSKEQFDKIHGLIFLKRDVEFHEENLKRPEKYDEAKYNDIRDKEGIVVGKKSDKAKEKIQELKNEGFEIEIGEE